MSRQDEIVVELVSTGLTQHQLGLLAQLVSVMSSAFVTRQSSDNRLTIADERRERDRVYQQERREKIKQTKASAKANDVAGQAKTSSDCQTIVADESSDDADERCNLSSFLSLETEEVKRTSEKGSKKEKNSGSARGTRLPPEVQLTLSDLDFALAAGMTESQARQAWAEFVDYWIGVPGQRGTKLDWSATWRNRVRQIAGKNGASNAKTGNKSGGSALAAIRDIRTGFGAASQEISDDRGPDRIALIGVSKG